MSASVRIASIFLLAWHLFLHVVRKYVLRMKSPGLTAFAENYRDDRVTPFSAWERERHAAFSKCIACGLCDPVCPSLRAAGREKFTGPMDLAVCVSRDPTESGFSPDPFRSLLCEACDRACPESVPVSEIISNMRRKARETHPGLVPQFYRGAESNLLRTGNIYGAPRLEAISSESRILYWRGCREAKVRSGGEEISGERLLERFGVKFKAVLEDCCGGLPAQMGLDYDASAVIARIESADADVVVASCPLCIKTLHRAMPNVRIRHVLSVVADKIGDNMKPLAGKKIAYHDSCLLAGALGIYELPREIIAKLGGELVRLPRERGDAPCCGAGGALPEVDPELARKIARDRIAEVISTGASTLLTSCHECAAHLRSAVNSGEPLGVTTISDVLLRE